MATVAAIVGGIAVAGTVLSASLWNLFRRRIPDLTKDDLLADPMNDLEVVRNLSDDDRAGLKQAFGDSPDVVWFLKDGDKLTEEDADDMASATSYMMDFVIDIAENYGHIIRSVDKDGKYQGSIVLIPPIKSFRYTAYTFAAIAHCGKPPPALWDDPARKARFNSFEQTSKYHHEVMHDCVDDHWYVMNIGVAPWAQGKRVGTRLLQQAVHLAGDKPLYLECHNGNVSYYEKFGFKVAKNYSFDVSKGKSSSKFYFNGMRRDPQ